MIYFWLCWIFVAVQAPLQSQRALVAVLGLLIRVASLSLLDVFIYLAVLVLSCNTWDL